MTPSGSSIRGLLLGHGGPAHLIVVIHSLRTLGGVPLHLRLRGVTMENWKKRAVTACGKRKRKPKPSRCGLHLRGSDSNAVFALLLASLSNLHHPHSVHLIKKCLLKIRPSLLSQSSVRPVLALLPALLSSNRSEIACHVADLIGAASLVSLEVNEEIASDSETLKGLISLLENPKRRVLLSACNAVLDLSTTTFGRHQLLKFSALEKLM